MIVSASRRTDIPAFYSDWFFNRMKEGYVCVRNPMSFHQVSKIQLTPDVVDCIVFWTKNPFDMLANHAQELENIHIPYYFQFTVNPYNQIIEPHVPKKEVIFKTFISLSEKIGKERLIWRYDPIIFTDTIDFNYHIKYFDYIAEKLALHTNKCIISFLDFYKKTERNMSAINVFDPILEQKIDFSRKLYEIASHYGLKLVTCAEKLDLSEIGIRHGQCIDSGLIAHLCKGKILVKKDKNQREECGCIESIDIGAYNTCRHGCLYCYANYSQATVEKQCKLHNPSSPLLFGELGPEDRIIERKMETVIDKQQTLL